MVKYKIKILMNKLIMENILHYNNNESKYIQEKISSNEINDNE